MLKDLPTRVRRRAVLLPAVVSRHAGEPSVRGRRRSASISRDIPVVLLNTGLNLDDHEDLDVADGKGMYRVDHLMTPQRNLEVQTRIISERARVRRHLRRAGVSGAVLRRAVGGLLFAGVGADVPRTSSRVASGSDDGRAADGAGRRAVPACCGRCSGMLALRPCRAARRPPAASAGRDKLLGRPR